MAQETITLQDGTPVQVADFDFGFTLEQKALVTEADDGTLVIEGYASDFDIDREEEAFEPGAFQKALDSYRSNPVMLYHHKYDTALGKFTDLKLDQKGLWVRGEVPKPVEAAPTRQYYDQIKSGVLRGFSVGGKFFRRMTESGPRIFKCDLREISVTPMPVNPRMLFTVAGKAFDGMDAPVLLKDETMNEAEVKAISEKLSKLESVFDTALEGKASQHPDGPQVAALQMHLQHIHTLATQLVGSKDEKVSSLANNVAKDVKTHINKVHDLSKRIGPLPNVYGGTTL